MIEMTQGCPLNLQLVKSTAELSTPFALNPILSTLFADTPLLHEGELIV